ncbi:hypothetical protein AB0F46_41470 [Streptomyces sp. NPDC026665]|uniref:hypothetical protein n=1 Tax=Streptomyces sp. NPDC026665 TaxID=3154798 RepID=UPI0033FF5A8F
MIGSYTERFTVPDLLRPGWMANTAFTDPDHLTQTLRRDLAHIQRHPELIDDCLTGTDLTPNPRS